jgi:hypothetical protein
MVGGRRRRAAKCQSPFPFSHMKCNLQTNRAGFYLLSVMHREMMMADTIITVNDTVSTE